MVLAPAKAAVVEWDIVLCGGGVVCMACGQPLTILYPLTREENRAGVDSVEDV